jgi:hypothetical protein
MKRTIILLSVIFALSYVGNAQTDKTKKTTDTVTIKGKMTDSLSVGVQIDSTKYATLYVYRPSNFVGSFIGYNLHITNLAIKDSIIGRAKNNSKFIVKVYQEGKTQIFAQTESKRAVNIDVKFGRKYFLKCGIATGIFVGRPQLDLIYPEQGELDYDNVTGR